MINDITRHENDNLGGVNSFEFILAEAVNQLPEVFEGAIHNEIELNDNYRWYKMYCTEFTMGLKEQQQDSDHGASFKKIFVGKIPKDRTEVTDILNLLKNRPLILCLTYNNGCKKIVGSPDEPMYFKGNLDTKTDITGRNEHDVVFEGEGVDKSPFYKV